MNQSIGQRERYEYPSASSFKQKILPSLDIILQKPTQVFYINADRDTLLYGNQGTVISIHPSCLTTSTSGLYKGKI